MDKQHMRHWVETEYIPDNHNRWWQFRIWHVSLFTEHDYEVMGDRKRVLSYESPFEYENQMAAQIAVDERRKQTALGIHVDSDGVRSWKGFKPSKTDPTCDIQVRTRNGEDDHTEVWKDYLDKKGNPIG